MSTYDDEENQLRSVALQNARSILLARQRAEEALLASKAQLEVKTQELAQQREWFQVTLASIGDAVITTDTTGAIISLNPVAEKLTGWKSHEASGRPVEAVFHIVNELTREPAPNPIRVALQKGIIVGLANHTALIAKDGSETSIEDSAAPIKDEAGQIRGVVMVFRDVTERRRTENELQQSEQLKAAILNAALDAIVTVDEGGKIVDFNPAAEATFGYNRNYAIGKPLAELIIPERLWQQVNFSQYYAPGDGTAVSQRIELQALHADGHEFPVELSIARIASITPPTYTATLRDITQAKQAALAQTRLAAIVENSADGIIGKELDGTIVSWNDAAQHIFGYGAQEMIGQSILKLIPEELHSEEDYILSQLKAGRRVEHYETIRLTKDGRRINVSLTSSPILDDHGTVIGASKIVRDITARKHADDMLRRNEETLRVLMEKSAREREELLNSERAARAEAERMGVIKDDFLATLSHELRTPLSAILGWTQVLRRAPPKPADVQKGLETIERNARVQIQLIEDLLDMSRITAGKIRLDMQPVHPVTFIEAAVETVRPAAEAKGIHIEKLLDATVPSVSGDPARLQQIVWNLLSNAIKFTPKNGTVQIMLEQSEAQIVISVKDTGMGIKPEFLNHVFERFRQADASTTRTYGGLGLGLAIVKNLVELHGGAVSVQSPGVDLGATFYVHLPMTVTQMNEAAQHQMRLWHAKDIPAESPAEDLSGIKVLVVDDEADGRELVKQLLDNCGATVYTASAAGPALQLLEQEQPHVLVSDIGMPDVDGYEFLRRVRALGAARGGKIPAIALTAFARPEDRTRALRAGFMVHLSKPVEPYELIATVASVVGRNT